MLTAKSPVIGAEVVVVVPDPDPAVVVVPEPGDQIKEISVEISFYLCVSMGFALFLRYDRF